MFLEVNGCRLHTVAMGGGPRTLVTHGGWVGNWELWLQPFELLSPTWRCVAYDHRGSGESVVPLDAITPQALVDDLFGVMDALGVEKALVAGESLGAIVVLTAALQRPERFEGLVLIDGSPGVVEDLVRPLIDGSLRDYPATARRFVDDCVPEADAEHIRRWGRDILMRSTGEAAARIFSCYLDKPEPMVPVDRIQVPTLVIHGDADRIVPISVGEWMASAIPGATFVRLAGAGHVPTITRPQEVVDAILQRFGSR